MEIVKLLAKKLFFGFLYGSGFTLGAWAIFHLFIVNDFQPDQSDSAVVILDDSRAKRLSSNLTILDSNVIVRPYLIDVIGTLKNNGDAPARHTELLVDLFDENGVFIYQCKSWLSQIIQPGGEENFKIDCHTITEEIYQSYSSYKVKVVR